jgi:hypothetical protein
VYTIVVRVVHHLVTVTGRVCHRHFLAEGEEIRAGHRRGTTVHRAVHCPIFLEARDFAQLAKGVTATPMVVHCP